MRWPASRPPHKSRQLSPTNPSTACSTGSVETASECDSSDPAAEVLVIDGPHSPPGFPRADGGADGGDPSRPQDEYLPEPLTSLQWVELRRRNMDALHTPIVEKPPRPEPWRTRAWLTWPSAIDWRISSEYSMSERVNGLQNPVDVNSFRPCRYIVLRFRIWRLQTV